MQPTDKRVPTVEQWEALADKIDEGGGGVQSDYDEYDSAAQDYIRNRKFYDKTPYFVYGEATGKYQYFYDSNDNLNYPFNQLPTINGITFDPETGSYINELLGWYSQYVDLRDAGAAANKPVPYWDSSFVEAVHTTYPLKATAWKYGGGTRTEDMTKYSAVADDGETVYLFVSNWAQVHVLVYKSLMIQLIQLGTYTDQYWNEFVPSVIVQSRVAQEVVEVPERFLPKASADKAGIVKTSDFVTSAGEGLVKESASLKVKAGLADYEENDSTKASYIQNRPFYEATSIEPQSIIGGTVPAYISDNQNSRFGGIWANLSETCAMDAESKSISSDTGMLYSYVTSETISNIVSAINNGKEVVFDNIGGTWFDMGADVEREANFTFTSSGISQLSNGVYVITGTTVGVGTTTQTYTPTAIYMGATVDICADGNDWMSQAFGTPMENGLVLVGDNFNWVANEGGYLPQFAPSTVWTISTEVEVSVLKQLDPKYLNTTGLILNGGTSAPTTSTVGVVGTLYGCVNNGMPEVHMCTAVSGSTYTWTKILPAV